MNTKIYSLQIKNLVAGLLCALALWSCNSSPAEKKLSIKGYSIGQQIDGCPKKITYQEYNSQGITSCHLSVLNTTYADYEIFSYTLKIYENKIFSVEVEIYNTTSYDPIVKALTAVYGKPNEDESHHKKWNRNGDSLFVFYGNINNTVTLVNHKLQEKQRQDFANKKIKDL